MKIEKSFVLNIVLGIVFGGAILFGLYKWLDMDIKTAQSNKQVVQFLQAQIDAQQKAINQSQSAPVAK